MGEYGRISGARTLLRYSYFPHIIEMESCSHNFLDGDAPDGFAVGFPHILRLPDSYDAKIAKILQFISMWKVHIE